MSPETPRRSLFAALRSADEPIPAAPSAPAPVHAPAPAAASSEVEALRKRLAELETALKNPGKSGDEERIATLESRLQETQQQAISAMVRFKERDEAQKASQLELEQTLRTLSSQRRDEERERQLAEQLAAQRRRVDELEGKLLRAVEAGGEDARRDRDSATVLAALVSRLESLERSSQAAAQVPAALREELARALSPLREDFGARLAQERSRTSAEVDAARQAWAAGLQDAVMRLGQQAANPGADRIAELEARAAKIETALSKDLVALRREAREATDAARTARAEAERASAAAHKEVELWGREARESVEAAARASCARAEEEAQASARGAAEAAAREIEEKLRAAAAAATESVRAQARAEAERAAEPVRAASEAHRARLDAQSAEIEALKARPSFDPAAWEERLARIEREAAGLGESLRAELRRALAELKTALVERVEAGDAALRAEEGAARARAERAGEAAAAALRADVEALRRDLPKRLDAVAAKIETSDAARFQAVQSWRAEVDAALVEVCGKAAAAQTAIAALVAFKRGEPPAAAASDVAAVRARAELAVSSAEAAAAAASERSAEGARERAALEERVSAAFGAVEKLETEIRGLILSRLTRLEESVRRDGRPN